MAATRMNIVYRYMPGDEPDLIERPDLGLEIRWTREEISDADVVVYYNSYSHDPTRTAGFSDRIRLLILAEPLVVHPPQYELSCWQQFDAVLTWNQKLVEQSDRFYYLPHINYGYPFPSGHGYVGKRPSEEQLRSRTNGVCMVVGRKYSLLSPELYSRRDKVARWFHDHSPIPFDTFGRDEMALPNYRGPTENKEETVSSYRYCLSFENNYHPHWSYGYVTEKMWDALHASSIPIYLGCANIEDIVPTECFIDYQDFDCLSELEAELKSRTEEDYLATVDRIWQFLGKHHPEEQYRADLVYQTALTAANESRERRAGPTPTRRDFPADFPHSGVSLRDRVMFRVSCLILKHPAILHVLYPLRVGLSKISHAIGGLKNGFSSPGRSNRR